MANEALLSENDYIVAVDASGSQGTDDCKGRTRWSYMAESIESFARDMSKIDSDGIGLVVFGGAGVDSFDGVDAKKVNEIFTTRSPRGSTPMAEGIAAALKLAGKSAKKDFILVATDGVPDEPAEVEKVIAAATQKLTAKDELTICFVQVGYDRNATEWLRRIDSSIRGAKHDVVKAYTIEQAERFPTMGDLVEDAMR